MESDIDQLELDVLVKYVVNEHEYNEALSVVQKFRNNEIATRVLRKYYTDLPEAIEEMACDLRVMAEKQGIVLFCLKTAQHKYFYLGSREEILFIGDYQKGLKDEDTLLYFGYKNEKDFRAKMDRSFTCEKKVPDAGGNGRATCVVCGVAEGELHIFGCPVEQCPWCDGQLNRCNCRFDQLGIDELEDEEQLERFEMLLEQKGRIVFQSTQSLAYPTAGDDPGPKK